MIYRTILLFGAPGAGKGTQGKILGMVPDLFHCACGDVFRSLKADSDVGRIFLEYSSRGQLVPNEPTIQLWHHYIDSCIKAGRFHPAQDTLVLDGIPRNVSQAQMLRNTLNVVAVFNLRCPDPEVLVQRLQRRALKENRLDDANLDVIKSRLETYEQESRPVLGYYEPGKIKEIDAGQAPVKVLFDILDQVVKL